jgi:uncharacterized protein YkwD
MYTVYAPQVTAHAPNTLLVHVNMQRRAAGVPELVVHPGLTQAAQGHADYMRDSGFWGHGDDWAERIIRHYPEWRAIAENIAGGYDSAAGVVNGWMASSGHRANIVNPMFTEAGVGYAAGGYYRWYWVLDFGARFG